MSTKHIVKSKPRSKPLSNRIDSDNISIERKVDAVITDLEKSELIIRKKIEKAKIDSPKAIPLDKPKPTVKYTDSPSSPDISDITKDRAKEIKKKPLPKAKPSKHKPLDFEKNCCDDPIDLIKKKKIGITKYK
jgi:hypothetical protein